MRPTFMGFEAARKGLAVNQKGIDIVGNNLANVYTEGYTRQRLDVYSIAPLNAKSRYATVRSDMAGQGVAMGGVSQTRDSFLDKRFRDEYGDVGYYNSISSILSDVEASICDPEATTDSGLINSMKTIEKNLQDFLNNSDQKVHANVVATAFKNLTQTLRQFDAKLNNVLDQQKSDLEGGARAVNEILSKLAGLNKSISDDMNSQATDNDYYGPNELLDQRNLLLDTLAQYGDIGVKTKSDGSVIVTMAGQTVVDGEKSNTLMYRENANGTAALNWNSDGSAYSSVNGALQGSIDMINGRGQYATASTESSERGILYYKDRLNMFANSMMNVFNNIVPESDANGDPMLDNNGNIKYKQLLGARTTLSNGTISALGTVPATAANLTLSDDWTADSSYIIYRGGDNATKYPSQLLNAIKSGSHTFSQGGVTMTMTFSEYVNDYVGICGTDVSFNQGRYDATSSIANQMMDARDAVSAVSPDEETTNMLLYNKSYQAVSRLITTLDEALDTLINKTGLVGR